MEQLHDLGVVSSIWKMREVQILMRNYGSKHLYEEKVD